MKDYSKENYVTISPSVEAWEHHVNNKVLNDYADLIKGSVADLGCNHGACTILAARNLRVTSIIGVDKNDTAIDVARQLLTACHEPDFVKNKVSYRTALFDNTGLEQQSLNCVIMFQTWEHIYPEDYDLVTYEILRILKPGGMLIVTTPFEKAHNDSSHVAWFTLASLQEVFSQRGFNVVECKRDSREACGDCINLVCRKA